MNTTEYSVGYIYYKNGAIIRQSFPATYASFKSALQVRNRQYVSDRQYGIGFLYGADYAEYVVVTPKGSTHTISLP